MKLDHLGLIVGGFVVGTAISSWLIAGIVGGLALGYFVVKTC